MAKKTGSVRNALKSGPFKRYLLGYVAAIIYHDGSEWLLNKAGHWEDRHGDKDQQNHVWPTKAAAMKVAKAADSEKFPTFVRPYAYETSNPESAKGLPLLSEAEPTEYVSVEQAE